jgi:alpha-mannosidase
MKLAVGIWAGYLDLYGWTGTLNLKRATLYSLLMHNYWTTNYAAGQHGFTRFRYTITSGEGFTPGEKARFGWEACDPLRGVLLTHGHAGDRPDRGSLLEANGDDLSVLAIKAAEDGRGTIVRLYNCGDKESTATLSVPGAPVEKAWQCNLIEEDEKPLAIRNGSVEFPVPSRGLATVRLASTS